MKTNYNKICIVCGKEFKGITKKCPFCAQLAYNKKRKVKRDNGDISYRKVKTGTKYSKHKDRGVKVSSLQRNKFSQETRMMFFEEGKCECYNCGKYHADCLHHILGRVSSSPLNAAPLNNNECHLYNPELGKKPIKSYFLKLTLSFLMDIVGYKLNEEDQAFIEKYREYYEG